MSDLPGTPPPPPGATPPPPASPPPPPGGFGGPPPPPPGGTPPPPGGFGGLPGGFTPPPTQPYGGGGEVPRLEVGAAIGYGWKKFTENVGPFIILMIAVFVAMFVAWLLLQVVNAAFNSITRSSDSSLVLLFGFLFWALSTAAYYLVAFLVQAGVLRAGLAVTRGETPEPSMLVATDNLLPFVLTTLLVGVGFLIGLLLCVLPGIIWLIFTAYAPLIALDKGTSPVDAIKGSIDWVKENFGEVFLILFLSYLVYIVGYCFCGIGALVSAPVALVAIVYSYRALNNETVVA